MVTIGSALPAERQWQKHATCYSNFQTQCWGPEYQEHEDIVDFFDMVVSAQMNFPTYDWLAKEGIKPSNSTKYSLSALESALTKASGAKPYVSCQQGALQIDQAESLLTAGLFRTAL